jgi:hypothetical protein
MKKIGTDIKIYYDSFYDTITAENKGYICFGDRCFASKIIYDIYCKIVFADKADLPIYLVHDNILVRVMAQMKMDELDE